MALLIFVIGVGLSACYAARLAPVEHGSGPGGAVAPSDRLEAWAATAGLPFGVGLVLMVVGGVLGRRIERAEVEAARRRLKASEGPVDDPGAVLSEISALIDALPHEDLDQHAPQIHEILDDVLEERVPAFVAHRAHLIAEMGLTRFAEMIGHFASFERNAARAWSALTDGAFDESERCLVRAKEALTLARESFERAHGAAAQAG